MEENEKPEGALPLLHHHTLTGAVPQGPPGLHLPLSNSPLREGSQLSGYVLNVTGHLLSSPNISEL